MNPITKGLYASHYEIGSAIHPEGTIGYLTALNYYGFSHQLNNQVIVLTPTRYREEEVQGMTYRFVLEDTTRDVSAFFNNAPLRIVSLERALVDCLLRPDLCGGMEEIWNSLQGLQYVDEKKILGNLEARKTKLLYKKTGFLLQKLRVKGLSPSFFEECKKNMSHRYDDIRDLSFEPGKYSSEWNLTYPEYMGDESGWEWTQIG